MENYLFNLSPAVAVLVLIILKLIETKKNGDGNNKQGLTKDEITALVSAIMIELIKDRNNFENELIRNNTEVKSLLESLIREIQGQRQDLNNFMRK